MHQMAMTGADWLSDRDKKAQQRAEAARKKAALEAARKLRAASQALNEYLTACLACNDASRSRGVDDSRTILIGNMNEYACFLQGRFDKEGA